MPFRESTDTSSLDATLLGDLSLRLTRFRMRVALPLGALCIGLGVASAVVWLQHTPYTGRGVGWQTLAGFLVGFAPTAVVARLLYGWSLDRRVGEWTRELAERHRLEPRHVTELARLLVAPRPERDRGLVRRWALASAIAVVTVVVGYVLFFWSVSR